MASPHESCLLRRNDTIEVQVETSHNKNVACQPQMLFSTILGNGWQWLQAEEDCCRFSWDGPMP